jgi:hypothetical protein
MVYGLLLSSFKCAYHAKVINTLLQVGSPIVVIVACIEPSPGSKRARNYPLPSIPWISSARRVGEQPSVFTCRGGTRVAPLPTYALQRAWTWGPLLINAVEEHMIWASNMRNGWDPFHPGKFKKNQRAWLQYSRSGPCGYMLSWTESSAALPDRCGT